MRSSAISLPVNSLQRKIEFLKRDAGMLIDFMYGTPERTRITFACCTALLALGMMMQSNDAGAVQMCVEQF